MIVNKKNIKEIKKIIPSNFMPYEIGYISEDKEKANIFNSLKW